MSNNTMLKIEVEKLVKAVEKLNCSVSDGIKMSVVPAPGNAGLVSFSSSTRTAQVIAVVQCISNATVKKEYLVDKEFVKVIRSLAGINPEGFFEIAVMDEKLMIKSGASLVPVAFIKDATFFEMENPKGAKCVRFNTEEFVSAVKKGSIASESGDYSLSCMKSAVAFLPGESGDIRIFSVNHNNSMFGIKELSAENKDVVSAIAKEKAVWLFDAKALSSVVPFFEGEHTDVYIMEKQYAIKNGTDFYVFIPTGDAQKFPVGIVDKMYSGYEKKLFEFEVNPKGFKGALTVAQLNPSPLYERDAVFAELFLEEKALKVTSYSGANLTLLSVNGEGCVHVAIGIELLNKALSRIDGSVKISGGGSKNPFYLIGDDESFRVGIAPAETREEFESATKSDDSADSEE